MKAVLKSFVFILIVSWISIGYCLNEAKAQNMAFDFYGSTFNFEADSTVTIPFQEPLANASIKNFYNKLNTGHYEAIIQALKTFKAKYHLNDWLYYQLIRKTAQEISPKNANYNRYTLYKWFLLSKSGYDAKIAIGNNQIIFYVRTEEDISDIPFFTIDHKKYMCLNYHDYGKLFERESVYKPVGIKVEEATESFSYKVTRMPDFNPSEYHEKQIVFNYKHKAYHFNVKVTNEVSTIFANYPIVDYGTYFNIPLSKATYESLIPILKANTKKMTVQNGVD